MNTFTWDPRNEAYFARRKLANGQFCQVALYRVCRNRADEYYVAFAVADKKKNLNGWFNGDANNNIELKTTGRCGVAALKWCRDMLLTFENEISLQDHIDTKVVVMGADARRFRVYERALRQYGYVRTKVEDGWALVKFLKQQTSIL